ncbi:hypothetical protein [Actinomadura macra]|uniref:hypothetical protein n=1 Tax=Actinomadura macra TaxID=46164 RepID=UPI00082C2D2F|nr:hypothetical protein [Actinomadura macra]
MCRFANIERFAAILETEADLTATYDQTTAPQSFAAELAAIADRLSTGGEVGTQHDAARRLIAEDLRRVSSADFGGIVGYDTVTERLDVLGPSLQKRLQEAGLPVGEAPLRVVDTFPEPFHRFAWAAFAPDAEDQDRYGIEPGVYFRRDRLRPFYSDALFAHEVVHTVTGSVDPEIYAMGLEEGVAEILGTCYAGLGVLPAHVLRNIIVHGRHGAERDKLWSVYLDHTRQASLLYREFGIEGIVALVRRGRAAIHEAEEAVMKGTYRELSLPRGSWDDATTELVEFACEAYLPSHVFSPLECLLALHARKGRTVGEVCVEAGVSRDVGAPMLEELGATSALFVQDGDRIGYSNVDHYLGLEAAADVAVIRYLPGSPAPGA